MTIEVPQARQREQLQRSPITGFRVNRTRNERLDLSGLRSTANELISEELRAARIKDNRKRDLILKDFSNKASKFTVEAASMVMQQKGSSVPKMAKTQREELRKRLSSLASQKQYQTYSGDIQNQIGSQLLSLDKSIIPHEYREMTKERNAIYEVYAKTAADKIITTSQTTDEFSNKLGEVYQAAEEAGIMKFEKWW